ncbi:unnamed protein product [Linum tenue]|uniref:DUF220 domain-containing protein n=1 Tax=Linum tenue TaxID=586396 RepID=A0AAV0LM78_9ROSI|nr:unnamed protein product [Linum tenue]
MGETEVDRANMDIPKWKENGKRKGFDPSFLVQLPNKLHNSLKSQLRRFDIAKNKVGNSPRKETGSSAAIGIGLDKQLEAWRENPSWVDQPPVIQVSVPKGSLCNLSVKVNVGLPPDAIYDIVIDPDNRRVFKNIKEVISRKVLYDDGQRQLVEVEQAAIWTFLWWSGTMSVHVLVDQNRKDHSMKFKQVKTGFMERFEGSWKVEPLFVDEQICHPLKPKTWADYDSCTGGRGRIGSVVSLEQLIQPSIVPPPPISWYLRGITSKTTEMIVTDLLAESARIREGINGPQLEESETIKNGFDQERKMESSNIKERWMVHRKNAKKQHKRLFPAAYPSSRD